MLKRTVATILALSTVLVSTAVGAALPPPDPPAKGYPLDPFPRTVSLRGPMRCPKVDLFAHPGWTLRVERHGTAVPAFSPRLTALEAIVRDVALRVYGRAPAHIDHLGSFKCRRIARYPDLLSEHRLGDAIDVSGFTFDKLPRGTASSLPKALRRSFKVTLLEHWDVDAKPGPAAAYHRRFLRELAAEVEARPDLFAVLLGPAYPAHKDHSHFDRAPYRLVSL
jgi:hypothetical protein